MIIYTKKIGYLAIRNYLANILFGFVSNGVSLQHLKTQLKLPQNICSYIALLRISRLSFCHCLWQSLEWETQVSWLGQKLQRIKDGRILKSEILEEIVALSPWGFYCFVLGSHVQTCNYAMTCVFIFQFVCICIFWSSRILAGNYVCLSASVLSRLRASSNTRERHRHHLCDHHHCHH